MITLIVVVVILAVDFVGRAKVFSDIYDIDPDYEDGYGHRDWDYYEGELDWSHRTMEETCLMDVFGGLIVSVFFIVAGSIMFSARRSYGPKMERKTIAVFVLSIVAPVVVLILWFLFNLFEITYISFIAALPILILNVAIYLSIFDLDQEKVKHVAFTSVIVFSVSLLLIRYNFDMIRGDYVDSRDRLAYLKTACIILMISDIGLIASFSTYLYSFRKALQFTKANPPQQDRLEMRLMTQQAQQLRMEVEILRLQKEQMELLSDIRSERIEGASTGLLTHSDSDESTIGGSQCRMGEHLREYDPSKR